MTERELVDSRTPTMAPHPKLPEKAAASIESSGGNDDAVDISMLTNASNNNDDNFNNDTNNSRSAYRLFMSLLSSSLCISGFIVALNGVAHMTGCPCLEFEDEETGGNGHALQGSVKKRLSTLNRMIESSSSTVGIVETYEVPRMLSDFDNITAITDKNHETIIVSSKPTKRTFGSRLLSAATSMMNIKRMVSLIKKNKKRKSKKEVVADNNIIASNTTVEDVDMNMDVYVRDMDDDERDDVEKSTVIPPNTPYKPPEMMDGSDCERDSIISMDLFSPITRSLGSLIPLKREISDCEIVQDISMDVFPLPLRSRTRSLGSLNQLMESSTHEMPKREMLL